MSSQPQLQTITNTTTIGKQQSQQSQSQQQEQQEQDNISLVETLDINSSSGASFSPDTSSSEQTVTPNSPFLTSESSSISNNITQSGGNGSGSTTPSNITEEILLSNTNNNNCKSISGKIFVGGLSKSTSTDRLRSYFQTFANVKESIVIKSNEKSVKSRGFGFVTFYDNNIIDSVLLSREHIIDSKKVEIRKAIPKENIECEPQRQKLFVGGIKKEVEINEFRNYFSKYGEILESNLLTEKNGNTKGFGFITFKDDSVNNQILNENHVIHGKKVDVRIAESKKSINNNSGTIYGSVNNNNNSNRDGFIGNMSPPTMSPRHGGTIIKNFSEFNIASGIKQFDETQSSYYNTSTTTPTLIEFSGNILLGNSKLSRENLESFSNISPSSSPSITSFQSSNKKQSISSPLNITESSNINKNNNFKSSPTSTRNSNNNQLSSSNIQPHLQGTATNFQNSPLIQQPTQQSSNILPIIPQVVTGGPQGGGLLNSSPQALIPNATGNISYEDIYSQSQTIYDYQTGGPQYYHSPNVIMVPIYYYPGQELSSPPQSTGSITLAQAPNSSLKYHSTPPPHYSIPIYPQSTPLPYNQHGYFSPPRYVPYPHDPQYMGAYQQSPIITTSPYSSEMLPQPPQPNTQRYQKQMKNQQHKMKQQNKPNQQQISSSIANTSNNNAFSTTSASTTPNKPNVNTSSNSPLNQSNKSLNTISGGTNNNNNNNNSGANSKSQSTPISSPSIISPNETPISSPSSSGGNSKAINDNDNSTNNNNSETIDRS